MTTTENDQYDNAPRLNRRNPISSAEEAAAFWRIRRQMARSMVWQTLTRSCLRFFLVVLLSAFLWFILFRLFSEGFAFFQAAIHTNELFDAVTHTVLTNFFFALMVMLVFSSAVILYGSLYRGPDVALLFSLPVRAERVFLHKFQEAVFLSSWAFLLLASPMLLAYGNVGKVPWYFYLEMAPALIAFTYLPAAAGAILCLCVVRWIPSQRLVLLLLIATTTFLAMLAYAASLTANTHADFFTPGWIQEMVGRLQATESRWLPSWWLSSGLLSAARGDAADSVMFLVLLVSNALFVRQLGVGCAARFYRSGYSRLYTQHSVKRYLRLAWIDRLATALLFILPRQMRQLIIKDFRVFRRDPLQWTQFLIFFGLLILYFVGVRRFTYDSYHIVWVHLISFLNVYVVGLLLATFTTRFIFPMVSLEARRFWILGLLPVRRETILWSKFAFALAASLLPCSGLVLLSDSMLDVDWLVAASHQITCVVLCLGLSGIAVGLGAGMPSPREQSPSRIAAGFGGTLNLVTSTLYIVAVVLLTAVPAHFYFASTQSETAEIMTQRFDLAPWLLWWLLWGTLGSLVVGAVATLLPLWLGFRAIRRFEF